MDTTHTAPAAKKLARVEANVTGAALLAGLRDGTITKGAGGFNTYALADDEVGLVINIGGNHRCARWEIVAIVGSVRYCRKVS